MLRGLNQSELIVPVHRVIGRVHLHQRADRHVVAHRVIARFGPSAGRGALSHALGLTLDLHHVVVLGDRPERVEALRPRRARPGDSRRSKRARGVEPRLVGVRRRVGEDTRRFVDVHAARSIVIGVTASSFCRYVLFDVDVDDTATRESASPDTSWIHRVISMHGAPINCTRLNCTRLIALHDALLAKELLQCTRSLLSNRSSA